MPKVVDWQALAEKERHHWSPEVDPEVVADIWTLVFASAWKLRGEPT